MRARTVEIKWLQIQEIENIEEVCLHFEESSFTEDVTQSELLRDGHVYIKIARTAERVAADAGQLESYRRGEAEAAVADYVPAGILYRTVGGVAAGNERIV